MWYRAALASFVGLGCVKTPPDGPPVPELGTSGPADMTSTGTSIDPTTGDGAEATSSGADPADSTSSDDGSEPPVKFDLPVTDAPEEGPPPDPTDIDVVLTADNAYAFGYGTGDQMNNYFGGIENTVACDIFCCSTGPEQYTVPAKDAAGAEYLYIVAWADTATTQGVLGQFRRVSGMDGGGFGAVVYTGDPGWEVCATGVDYSPGGGGPTLEIVNEQIEICNAGDSDPATTSQGWVDETGTAQGALAVGEANDTAHGGSATPGNEFPITCEDMVDAEARWMWFNWDPDNITWPEQSPFMYPYGSSGNPMHDFMIFRLAADELPFPPEG